MSAGLRAVEDREAAVVDPSRRVEDAVIRTNLAYARLTRGQFPHARALVMVEGIANAVRATSWRSL